MAVIKTIEKGESLTFGFVLPDTYNLSNLEDVKIYIGSTVYAHTMVSRTARVELTSNATALLTGRNVIHFVIDDAIFGIKKVNCGMLEVLPTQATHKDTSVNTGYDVEIVLTIDVETVTVESVLYNTLSTLTISTSIVKITSTSYPVFILSSLNVACVVLISKHPQFTFLIPKTSSSIKNTTSKRPVIAAV